LNFMLAKLIQSDRFTPVPTGPDLAGGVTAAVVSLPLALAFGVASGAGASAGLIGAFCVGLFASLFGSSKQLISEPTGPMTVVMTTVMATLTAAHPEGGMTMAFTVVMIAGLFQFLLGTLKFGQFITLMPYSVISGFMSGIGVILIILQIPAFLGVPSPPGGVTGVLSHGVELMTQVNTSELIIALIAIAIIFKYPKAYRRRCPAQLVALVFCTLLSMMFGEDIRRIGEIPMGLPSLHFPTASPSLFSILVLDGMILGTLGAIDTVLTAMIADSITKDNHDSNRELMGQGIGNMMTGFIGGLPGAGATMGTVVNIQSGAISAWSGVIRALLLVIVTVGAAPLIAPIPMSVLAAIALKVGIDILDWSFIQRVHRLSRASTVIMYGVLLLTVFVDLIIAVGLGVFISNLMTIKRLTDMQADHIQASSGPDMGISLNENERDLLDRGKQNIALLFLGGPMIFSAAKTISRQQKAIAKANVLLVDVSLVPLMGVTVGLAIEKVVKETLDKPGRVIFIGAQKLTRKRLETVGLLDHEAVSECNHREEALEMALKWVEDEPVNGSEDEQQV
jgi:SulP family sulfate permease